VGKKKNELDPADRELYNTVEGCYEMIQHHETQRLANHKLNELVAEHGKDRIVKLMERAKASQ
jgi:hypothetical protein